MDKRKLHYELQRVIQVFGTETPKRHGNFWELVLPSKIKFMLDDYNHAITAYYPDGTNFYFGGDWGGFTGEHVSELHYVSTIELIENECKNCIIVKE